MKLKTKVLFLLTLLIIFLFSSIFNSRFSKNIITNNNYIEFNEKNQTQIKQTGFWNLTGSIFIDDSDPNYNWSKTASENDWCSGSGNWTDPYVIENVTIDGQGSDYCIEIKDSNTYFIIRNCSLYNSGSSPFDAGIKLDTVDNGKIINNNCSDNNRNGIYLDHSDNNTLSGNTASNNFYRGISLYYSDINTLSGNIADNNVIGIWLGYNNNNKLSGNIANNNDYGIRLDYGNNNTLSGNNASNNKINDGIGLYFSDNNTISGNTVNNNSIGIFLGNSNNNTISGNTANNNNVGIYLYYCFNNTLSGNFMNFCGISLYGSLAEVASHSIDNTNLVNNKLVYYYVNETGLESSDFTDAGQIILINCNNLIISELDGSCIHLYYCVNNTLSENNASDNNCHGIYLDNSDNNTLSGNNANNNTVGICLIYSDNNTLSGNNANNNDWYGIYLLSGHNNTFSGNTINNNSNGITLDSTSNNNKIFLNHFINNEINAEDNGINNTWDNGFIGNYWDDYDGVDANDDGIGDTPYIISGTAVSHDNFPIWTDGDDIAPVITIIFPLLDGVFGLDAPNYNLSIDELNLDTIWYTLDGGGTNYTITGLTGTFNQTAWGALSEGSVTIRFYANDTAGNIGFIDVEVLIEFPEDVDGLPIISFGNYYILFMFITILSFIILEKRKKK